MVIADYMPIPKTEMGSQHNLTILDNLYDHTNIFSDRFIHTKVSSLKSLVLPINNT